MPDTLQIITYNAHGLHRQKYELIQYINIHNPDIILIQETFLKPKTKFSIPNYTIYRNDRDSKGGGTAILVKTTLTHSEMIAPQLDTLETTAITINNILIASVYKPPNKPPNTKDTN